MSVLPAGLAAAPPAPATDGPALALIDPKSPGEPRVVEAKGAVSGMPVRGDLVAFASRRDSKVVTLDLSGLEHYGLFMEK